MSSVPSEALMVLREQNSLFPLVPVIYRPTLKMNQAATILFSRRQPIRYIIMHVQSSPNIIIYHFPVINCDFPQVKNTETFWKWLVNDTIPVLLGKRPSKDREHFLDDGCSFLLGTAILRQQRIKPGGRQRVLMRSVVYSVFVAYMLGVKQRKLRILGSNRNSKL